SKLGAYLAHDRYRYGNGLLHCLGEELVRARAVLLPVVFLRKGIERHRRFGITEVVGKEATHMIAKPVVAHHDRICARLLQQPAYPPRLIGGEAILIFDPDSAAQLHSIDDYRDGVIVSGLLLDLS